MELEQELAQRGLNDIYKVLPRQFDANLSNLIIQLGDGCFFDAIYGIPRGGLIPATIISYKFDKPLLLNDKEISKHRNVLVVDDICCKGTTLFNMATKYKNIIFAPVYYRNTSKFVPDYCGHTILDNKYWIMPWENIDV